MAQRSRTPDRRGAPAGSSLRPQRGGLARAPHSGTATIADLGSIAQVKDLLGVLNDAYASAERIEVLVASIPCLRARCIKRALGSQEDLDMPLSKALPRIGNAGLEGELLTLLEDLTVLRFDHPAVP
jgi:hypothetical protein